MQTSEPRNVVCISEADLDVVAAALMARFPVRSAEQRRLERLRPLLDAATELSRALSTHTHHSLVHAQGTHGISDLDADTAALCSAISQWAEQVRSVADAYRQLVREVQPPPLLSFEATGSMLSLGGSR